MFEHLTPHHFPTPPPTSAPGAYGPRRRSVDRAPSATTFVATLIMLVLATVSALALIAASPAGIAVPMAMLLIGGLIGGTVAMRGRAAAERRALAGIPRPSSHDMDGETRARSVQRARADRAMLLRAGRGESWRRRR